MPISPADTAAKTVCIACCISAALCSDTTLIPSRSAGSCGLARRGSNCTRSGRNRRGLRFSKAAAASPKSVRAVFEFKVQNAVGSRGGYYLDSEKDFHSATNLGVVIRPTAVPELTKKYGADLKAALLGKTVKVIGQVRRRVVAGGTATATQVDVTHAGQILSVS